jgi:hypothetical protein
LMFDQTPAGIRESKTGISGSRSCTKNHKTGVFAFLRHMSSAPKRTSTQIHKERHKFDRPADTQRLSVTGPPPTCPFIFNRQCQRADAHPLPVRLFRASVVPTKKRHETNARPVARPRPLAGGAIYVWTPQPSTGFFAILLQFAAGTAPGAVSGSLSLRILDRIHLRSIKGRKRRNRRSFQALWI